MKKFMTLASAKEALKTDKVFETTTSFGVNAFGKYSPNITFILPKEWEVGPARFRGRSLDLTPHSPMTYRKSSEVKSMVDDINVDFDGEPEVLFGDFWLSKKGGACFRPKSALIAQHMLVRVGWGGAFTRTRGWTNNRRTPEELGAAYFRRACSNGGGTGYDYWILPVGFLNVIHDEEIDGDVQPTTPDFAERAKSIRKQFSVLEKAGTEVRERFCAEKARVEEESRTSRAALLPRLEHIMLRVSELPPKPFYSFFSEKEMALGELYFSMGWGDMPYSEENVFEAERRFVDYEGIIPQSSLESLRERWGQ